MLYRKRATSSLRTLRYLLLYSFLFCAGYVLHDFRRSGHSSSFCRKHCHWNKPLTKEERIAPFLGNNAAALEDQITQTTSLIEQFFSSERRAHQLQHGKGVAICAIFRNEAPYLREWLEYHQLIGVSSFYLMNNLSEDDFLDVLVPYIRRGAVTLNSSYYRFYGLQPSFYQHCIERFSTQHAWIIFLDLDEFVVPHSIEKQTTGLETLLPTELATLSQYVRLDIPRKEFCSSGHKTKPPGLVLENYTLRRKQIIFRKAAVNFQHSYPVQCNWTYDSVHHCELLHADRAENCKPGKTAPCRQNFSTKFLNSLRYTPPSLSIHHYGVKSREEFENKANRGSARLRDAKFRHYWKRQHDGCSVEDTGVLNVIAALKERMGTT